MPSDCFIIGHQMPVLLEILGKSVSVNRACIVGRSSYITFIMQFVYLGYGLELTDLFLETEFPWLPRHVLLIHQQAVSQVIIGGNLDIGESKSL